MGRKIEEKPYNLLSLDRSYIVAKRIMLLVMTIYIVFLISMFSSQNSSDSSTNSLKVVKKTTDIIKSLGLMKKDVKVDINKLNKSMRVLHTLVRKIAHFVLFASYGGFQYLLFDSYNVKNKIYTKNIFCGLMAAGMDEIHQSFVPGRSTQIGDVCIDLSGVMFGVFTVIVYTHIKSRINPLQPRLR